MSGAVYNEIEPYAADWLVNLAREGHIANGRVERRSIADLVAGDVRDATQFHAFAGIGVWSRALRLAGWPDDVRVWTGSCPCQPFSAAGRRGGFDDARHLWPEWFRLIRECRPPVIFGEQVASSDGLEWLDVVSADLEREGYAVGAADLCAAGVGAPHIRQRLYFVAYAEEAGRGARRSSQESGRHPLEPRGFGATCNVANPDEQRREGIGLSILAGRSLAPGAEARRCCETGELGDASGARGGRDSAAAAAAQDARPGEGDLHRSLGDVAESTGATRGFWRDAEWIPCIDERARPAEPGTFPLAHRSPGRVGRLRAYGNAIVAPLAAEFIRAACEAIGMTFP